MATFIKQAMESSSPKFIESVNVMAEAEKIIRFEGSLPSREEFAELGQFAREEMKKQHKAALMKAVDLLKSGFAGVSRAGRIVDRREDPLATPMPENPLMSIPKPADLPNVRIVRPGCSIEEQRGWSGAVVDLDPGTHE